MDVEGWLGCSAKPWLHDLVDKVDGQENLCELNKAACYLRFEEYEQATTSCGAVLENKLECEGARPPSSGEHGLRRAQGEHGLRRAQANTVWRTSESVYDCKHAKSVYP